MKIAFTEGENLQISLRMVWLMVTLKVIKQHGFTLSSSVSFSGKYTFRKTTGVGVSQIDPPQGF